MQNTNKKPIFISIFQKNTFGFLILAIVIGLSFAIPNYTFAGTGSGSYFGLGSSGYDYVDIYPVYSTSYDYSYPSYSGYSYSYPSYSYPSYSYSSYSYSQPKSSKSSYTSYSYPSYSYNSSPSSSNSTASASASATASASASVNNNINISVNGGSSNNNYDSTLSGYCSISPTNASVNQDVSFYASASGGNGSYSYSWTGSDNINSSSQSFTGRFTSPGSKYATVTIRSGSQSITKTCSAYVDSNYYYGYNNYYNSYYNGYNNLSVSCVANPSNANTGTNVVWTAYVTGGYGSYTYSWTGTDGLSYGNSNQIQKVYTTSGTKTATVTVYNQYGQSTSATCNTNINGISSGNPVSGVYLSEVPDTGIELGFTGYLFIAGILIISIFAGFMTVKNREFKENLEERRRG